MTALLILSSTYLLNQSNYLLYDSLGILDQINNSTCKHTENEGFQIVSMATLAGQSLLIS